MSETTKIQWADATFNPWIGCTKVSAGCKNCYAENVTRARVLRSQGQETWGKGAQRSRTSVANWKQPTVWNALARLAHGRPPRVFPSLCDWLDDEVPIEWLTDFLRLMHDTPALDWLLLTKRPENFFTRVGAIADARCYAGAAGDFIAHGHPFATNAWLGVSVEDQAAADKRIPQLMKIPATIRFLSVEPLLGPVDLRLDQWIVTTKHSVDWVIVGGESGADARPCDVEWVADIVRQCAKEAVPCFVKQLGSNPIKHGDRLPLRHAKGGDLSEWYDCRLEVREFPR